MYDASCLPITLACQRLLFEQGANASASLSYETGTFDCDLYFLLLKASAAHFDNDS